MVVMSDIVQYVVIRGDLMRLYKWSIGALIAQGCHACCAANHLFYLSHHTQSYLADLDRMHKVILEVFVHCPLYRTTVHLFRNTSDKSWSDLRYHLYSSR